MSLDYPFEMGFLLLIFSLLFVSSVSKISTAIDTIALSQTITDGQTLVSAGQIFELGFFSPGNSTNRYLGIWFKKVGQNPVVWVANRNNPVTDSFGVLTISTDGNINLINGTKSVIWVSNSSRSTKNPVAQLLDSGNFVLRDEDDRNSKSYLWQSFDYPCDTLLPGMKLGSNLTTGQSWYLTSWKSLDDPSPGDYIYKLELRGLPQVILRKKTEVKYRSGPFDGVRFGSSPELQSNSLFNPTYIFNTEDVYYTYENNDKSAISRLVLNQSGLIQQIIWNVKRLEWMIIVTLQQDNCEEYNKCGPYGTCSINETPICKCLKGFKPRSAVEWNSFDWSGGCVAQSPSVCGMKEGFRRFEGLKLPDTSNCLVKRNSSLVECEKDCLSNCSCTAYAKTAISSCIIWFGELSDIREFNDGGQELYVRMAASELDSDKQRKNVAWIAAITTASGILLLGLISWFIIWNKRKNKRASRAYNRSIEHKDENVEEDLELPLFQLVTVATATNNFSSANKIGQGGFGPVYKGELSTGQEIAVKRLSKDSGQGLNEFKNEVVTIANLQHRNLVKVLGCCIQGEERMLIYEYMRNKSLDLFIFDQTRGTSLAWQKRFDIIVGIARGLLYLHRDSRLRIIHRDLKASNILLDSELNPKISDFGVARIFRVDQTEENTNRVIGTYGYMPPEYAIDGLFSVKSDVFSFGVLVLEIMSGKKNRGFYRPDHDLNLLGHAWKLWNDGIPLALLDELIEGPVPVSEALRCIQVGLLCVQLRPEDRPTMPTVLLMLDSENPMLPQPKQPGFYTQRFPSETDSSSTRNKSRTTANEVTITMLEGR